jgi:hypothetical protein
MPQRVSYTVVHCQRAVALRCSHSLMLSTLMFSFASLNIFASES